MTDSDVKPVLKRGHYAVEVDLTLVAETPKRQGFPWGNGVYCSMPSISKQHLGAAHPTGGHVTQSEHHRRGRHVLLGAVVDQQVQTYLTKLLGVLSTVPLLWRLHVASRKPRGREAK